MKHETSILLPLLSLLLLTGATSRESVKFATGEPIILDDDARYLELLSEAEYRQEAKKHAGEEGFIPLKACPTGLSPRALFDQLPAADHTVTLAVDGLPQEGYRVVADLNADGDLRNDSSWPMERRNVQVWDFTGARKMKDAWVAEVDSVVGGKQDGEGSPARVKFRVTFTGDKVQFPDDPRWRPQALLAQSTLRKGKVSGLGREIVFALRGFGGIYDNEFNAVLFDLNGDGNWDPTNRASSEYFWVWERDVKLNGRSYEFSVDRYGQSLTLKPLAEKLPTRPSLEVGQPAPDFSFLDFEGKERRLSEYRGKVVLIDFWGVWCPGCVSHVKHLVDGYQRLHGKGFEILGVHSGGQEKEVRKFVAEHGMTWSQTIETGEFPKRRPLQRLYRVFGAPNYFLVDRDGSLLTNDVRDPDVLLAEAEKRLGVQE
jgi:thiol-disulfide isomerase/thioredoxin